VSSPGCKPGPIGQEVRFHPFPTTFAASLHAAKSRKSRSGTQSSATGLTAVGGNPFRKMRGTNAQFAQVPRKLQASCILQCFGAVGNRKP